jgi:myo-inositol 2-dehydrogenase/D-chiro-inositol 1-dehydrogenase
MVTSGDIRRTSMTFYGAQGVVSEGMQRNVDLFHDAYVAELADFVGCVRTGARPKSTGEDARAALAIALAAIRSVSSGRPVCLAEVEEP